MPKIAINGLGRIGRAALKILLDADGVEVAALNDLVEAGNLAYLLAHDSVYGRYGKMVTATDGALSIDGLKVPVFAERDPARLPWRELGIDLVLECTGAFRREEELRRHLEAGARFVILSAPARTETVATVVPGVNQAPDGVQVISCASCTTNSITPVVEVLERRIGIERAIMSTVHAYTASQQLVDGPSKDVRRGRAAGINMVPASTGAALATIRALPTLAGRFDGVAIRVPVPVGSIADITMVTARPTTAEEVNDLLREEADSERYRGVLAVAEEPMVSTDIIGDARASVIDAAMTRVVDGTLVKVMSWYDNEWGFTHQMVREALSVLGAGQAP
ncbi:type I glyceraldehyde-3-phosphate dehydrogenase [Streptomyces platensis]|nr:type I glyceraldehyde-3-phosphate dehydrogenase [Streptomyces platensis]QEV50493.1 type I glyceraldehyde-3-phosphate dehydrogenase [Streptomyces platensis]